MPTAMVIPFYGSRDPGLFAIERAAMDRPGRVVAALDRLLPSTGTVVDIGAGDGFTAARLDHDRRNVIAMEPSEGMRAAAGRRCRWIAGEAERLPFRSGALAGAYATWAFFFAGHVRMDAGIGEADRVVRAGGPIVVVDNIGEDEFTSWSAGDIVADAAVWSGHGFDMEVVDTVFEFESREDARRLMRAYFGDRAPADPPLSVTYRVGIFSRPSRGTEHVAR